MDVIRHNLVITNAVRSVSNLKIKGDGRIENEIHKSISLKSENRNLKEKIRWKISYGKFEMRHSDNDGYETKFEVEGRMNLKSEIVSLLDKDRCDMWNGGGGKYDGGWKLNIKESFWKIYLKIKIRKFRGTQN